MNTKTKTRNKSLIVFPDKKTETKYKEISKHIDLDRCIIEIEKNVMEDLQRPVIEAFIEYVYSYKIYDPVGRDALLTALIFWHESISESENEEIRLKKYNAYISTLKGMGLLDFKKLMIQISKNIVASKDITKVVDMR